MGNDISESNKKTLSKIVEHEVEIKNGDVKTSGNHFIYHQAQIDT